MSSASAPGTDGACPPAPAPGETVEIAGHLVVVGPDGRCIAYRLAEGQAPEDRTWRELVCGRDTWAEMVHALGVWPCRAACMRDPRSWPGAMPRGWHEFSAHELAHFFLARADGVSMLEPPSPAPSKVATDPDVGQPVLAVYVGPALCTGLGPPEPPRPAAEKPAPDVEPRQGSLF